MDLVPLPLGFDYSSHVRVPYLCKRCEIFGEEEDAVSEDEFTYSSEEEDAYGEARQTSKESEQSAGGDKECQDDQGDLKIRWWSEFPKQMGYKIDDDDQFEELDPLGDSTHIRFKAFLQSWLWFGVLRQFLWDLSPDEDRSEFDYGRFIEETYEPQWHAEGKRSWRRVRWLQLTPLRKEIDDIIRRRGTISEETLTTVKTFLGIAQRVFRRTRRRYRVQNWGLQTDGVTDEELVFLSIEQLFYVLFSAMAVIGDFPPTKFYEIAASKPSWTYQRMLDNGWCPSSAHRLHVLASNPVCYFASFLKPGIRTSHGTCSEKKCEKANIDESTYETKHDKRCLEPGYICTPVCLAGSNVVDALNGGSVPRVPLGIFGEDDPDDGCGERSLPVTTKGEYIAISHVWAEGWGNPHDNSLPRCQVERLMEYCYNLAEESNMHMDDENPVGVWIDTLCIPLEQVAPIARKKAIQLLNKTFADASRVLIISNDLLNASVACEPHEIMARLLVSLWSQRLWTLEEGLLGSQNLYMQMADGVVEFWKTVALHPNQRNELACLHLEASIALYSCFPNHWHNTMANKKGHEAFQFKSFLDVVKTLRFRASAKAEDEAICLASICRMIKPKRLSTEAKKRLPDVGQLLRVEPEDRMKHIYLFIKWICPSIIFLSGPKLQSKGYTWAPESFMRRDERLFWALRASSKEYLEERRQGITAAEGDELAYIGENWIEYRWRGCLVDFGDLVPKHFFLIGRPDNWAICKTVRTNPTQDLPPDPEYEAKWWEAFRKQLMIQGTDKPQYALVFAGYLDRPFLPDPNSVALVRITETSTENNTITAKYIGTLALSCEDRLGWARGTEPDFDSLVNDKNTPRKVTGEMSAEDLKAEGSFNMEGIIARTKKIQMASGYKWRIM